MEPRLNRRISVNQSVNQSIHHQLVRQSIHLSIAQIVCTDRCWEYTYKSRTTPNAVVIIDCTVTCLWIVIERDYLQGVSNTLLILLRHLYTLYVAFHWES